MVLNSILIEINKVTESKFKFTLFNKILLIMVKIHDLKIMEYLIFLSNYN